MRALVAIAVSCLTLSALSFASEPQVLNLKVKGMVCAFCATGLKKILEKQPAIESASIQLSKQSVQIVVKRDHQVTHEELKEWVNSARLELSDDDSLRQDKTAH